MRGRQAWKRVDQRSSQLKVQHPNIVRIENLRAIAGERPFPVEAVRGLASCPLRSSRGFKSTARAPRVLSRAGDGRRCGRGPRRRCPYSERGLADDLRPPDGGDAAARSVFHLQARYRLELRCVVRDEGQLACPGLPGNRSVVPPESACPSTPGVHAPLRHGGASSLVELEDGELKRVHAATFWFTRWLLKAPWCSSWTTIAGRPMSRGACRLVRRAIGDVVSLRRAMTALASSRYAHYRNTLLGPGRSTCLGLFTNGGHEVLIEVSGHGVEPRPRVGHRFQHDGAAAAPNPDLPTVDTIGPRQSHRLRATGPKRLRRFHYVPPTVISQTTIPSGLLVRRGRSLGEGSQRAWEWAHSRAQILCAGRDTANREPRVEGRTSRRNRAMDDRHCAQYCAHRVPVCERVEVVLRL